MNNQSRHHEWARRSSGHGRSCPDVLLRQISQVVHLAAATVALIVVLSARPEAMFPPDMTASTSEASPWTVLCATAIGVITWDAAAAALRWRWRRRNHGLPVGSLLEAFGFAENALSGRSRYRETDGGIWRSAAVLPLTALVYTASQQDDEQALPWLTRTVELLSTGDHDAAWRESTVAVSRVDDELGRWWVSAVWAMDARQRASVAAAMREAILPYAGVNR